MRNANGKLLLVLVALVVVVAVAGLLLGGGSIVPSGLQAGQAALRITATNGLPIPEPLTEDHQSPTFPEGTLCLLVQASGVAYTPVALTAEGVYTFTQPDGGVNHLNVTPTSIVMDSADCSTQDCVSQGSVTADSLFFRPLGGQIICLPHQLIVELIPADELDGRLVLSEVMP